MYAYGLKFFQRVEKFLGTDPSLLVGARKSKLELLRISFYYGLAIKNYIGYFPNRSRSQGQKINHRDHGGHRDFESYNP